MVVSKTIVRVRYADTDQMKIVYHGKYLEYFEVGRTEMMRELGLPYKVIEDNGYIMPLIASHMEYKHSALYDELLEIETRVEKLPLVKVHIEYKIKSLDRNLTVVKGYTDLVFVKQESNKVTRSPEFFLEKFRSHFDKKD